VAIHLNSNRLLRYARNDKILCYNNLMKQNTQNGNAIVLILVAIALFAALGVAFSNTSRTSSSFLSDAEAEAYANQIIAYGNDVKSAVKRLQLRGCSDTEISFENNVVSGYENPNSPTDKSCHVFDVAGGGLQWQEAPPPYANTGPLFYEGKFNFIRGTEWNGNGTTCGNETCGDLIMFLSFLDENICGIINNKLGYTTTPEDTLYGGIPFVGVYPSPLSQTLADEANGSEAIGRKSACFLRTSDTEYIYTQILIAR